MPPNQPKMPVKPVRMVNPCTNCGKRVYDNNLRKFVPCHSNEYYQCAAFKRNFELAWEATTQYLVKRCGLPSWFHHSHPAEHYKEYPPHPAEKPEKGEDHDKQ